MDRALVIRFADGVSRCVKQLEMRGNGSVWVHAHELDGHIGGRVKRSIPPPKPGSLTAGRVILYRVDGKGWRRVRLVRPLKRKEWRHVRKAGLGSSSSSA